MKIERRYDIDWLRVIAIGLLLVYHIAIGFQPWGVFIRFIQNGRSLDRLWVAMSMLNIWRIPLLFYVSGMGVSFALRNRNLKQLLLERTRRIALPFIFGVFFIVPLHVFLWQGYYSQDLTYSPAPGHLWFLAYIFIYVVLLSPLFYYLLKKPDNPVKHGFQRLYRNPSGLLLITCSFMLETIIIRPALYEGYALTVHGFVIGFLAFFFGFTTVLGEKNDFWQTVKRWRWFILFPAAGLYIVRVLIFDLHSPAYLVAFESSAWIFCIFGFASAHLNRPGKALNYLSQGAYPVYIVHMTFLYLGSVLLFPLHLPAAMKLLLLVSVTVAGSLGFYELVIRRIRFLRPLFGLKTI